MTKMNETGLIDVCVAAHPFSADRACHSVKAGGTVADIVRGFQPDDLLSRYAHVYINSAYVPQAHWARVRPRAGTAMTVRMVPMGGGGKNPLRTVLSLAVMAGTGFLGASVTGMMGSFGIFGAAATRLATAGLGLLGNLAINALAPPPAQRLGGGNRESRTLFIENARNEATLFGRVPKVLGRHRFTPPFGALPYTETAGSDQYLRLLFVWGYGPLEITDLKIGETPLSEFDGVQVETRRGYPDDAPLTLYANSVLQTDMQVTVTAADGYVTRTTETDADEISVDITLPRGLLKIDGSGNRLSRTVELEIQYSPSGLNDWSAPASSYKPVAAQVLSGCAVPERVSQRGRAYDTVRIDRIVVDPASGTARLISGALFRIGLDSGSPEVPAVPDGSYALARVERRSGDASTVPSVRITDERNLLAASAGAFENADDFLVTPGTANKLQVAAGGLKYPAFLIRAAQSAAIRKSVTFRVPRGQYDVRVRRLTPDSITDDVFDTTVLTAVRTLRYAQPVNMPGLAMTALRIKASDQLNGVIDQFNGVVQSILPDWDGAAWTDQATSNPAALFRHVLQGSANARPLDDSRLDMAKIEAWHESCAAAGREYNAVIDYDVSVRDVLHDIASVGRASPTLIDGKWAVVEDKHQDVPVQHFTPRNTFGFRGEKAFDDLPQGLRVRFLNRAKGWRQDERYVYDDGFDAGTATRYETLQLSGVTDAEQAWRDGRYHLATARLRPELYTFYADVEHIVCTRGDMVRFTHDVPLIGLMSARVKSLDMQDGALAGVTLDAGVPMWEGKSYAVRFRTAAGASVVANVETQAGTRTEIRFYPALPEDCGVAVGDLALFGESGQESVELIVRSIEPQRDLNARITCADANPQIHTASLAEMPSFDSVLTAPAVWSRPPVPVLAQIQSGLETMIRHADGSLLSRVAVTLTPPAFTRPLSIAAQIRVANDTEYRSAEVLSLGQNRISITDVQEGESYDIQLRYVSADGMSSPPLLIANYRVEGTTALPADVTNFNINVLGATAHLSWSPVPDIDLSFYTLRFALRTDDVTWGSATDLIAQIPKTATSVSIPAAVGTYLIKAVDIGGRLSMTEALSVSTVAGLAGYNAVLQVTEDGLFTGDKDDVGIADGSLRLSGADCFDDWEDIDAVPEADIGYGGLVAAGVYTFAETVDLGTIYTSRLSVDLRAAGIDTDNTIEGWPSVDVQASWDQSVDPSLWGVTVELRTTDDDPAGAPMWSAWKPLVVGDYSARAFQFRARLSTAAPTVTPSVSRLRVTIDMPDRTVAGSGLDADAAGTNVVFDRAFRAKPAVSVTPHNMTTGDYYTVSGISAAGFSVRFFNASGTGISRTFDYLAKGFGEQL